MIKLIKEQILYYIKTSSFIDDILKHIKSEAALEIEHINEFVDFYNCSKEEEDKLIEDLEKRIEKLEELMAI
jgi:hypothetical protein